MKSESVKHTPGPWVTDGRWIAQSFRSGQPLIADCSTSESHRPEGSTQANAHLIAAAPELLSACQDTLAALNVWLRAHGIDQQVDVMEGMQVSCGQLKSAIAKATGSEVCK